MKRRHARPLLTPRLTVTEWSRGEAGNPSTPPITLVWHISDPAERDWIHFLLRGAVDSELTDLEFTLPRSKAIHVVSSNTHPLMSLDSYFRACRKRVGSLVLIHLSDEWFSGGYRLYGNFDQVFRTHHTWLARSAGVLTIPLGYPNSESAWPRPKPASAREYAWSFVGEVKASRPEMIAAMRSIEPHVARDTRPGRSIGSERLSKEAYDRLLFESAFSPCPMGNVMLETWRVYESLEAGAIPLIERRLSMDYYRDLLGEHPMPTFRSWDTAAQFCRGLLADPAALDSLQSAVVAWWGAKKDAVRADVLECLRQPSSRSTLRDFALQPANRSAAIFEPLRLVELVRHQTARGLLRRLRGPRAIVRRIRRDHQSSTLPRR